MVLVAVAEMVEVAAVESEVGFGLGGAPVDARLDHQDLEYRVVQSQGPSVEAHVEASAEVGQEEAEHLLVGKVPCSRRTAAVAEAVDVVGEDADVADEFAVVQQSIRRVETCTEHALRQHDDVQLLVLPVRVPCLLLPWLCGEPTILPYSSIAFRFWELCVSGRRPVLLLVLVPQVSCRQIQA